VSMAQASAGISNGRKTASRNSDSIRRPRRMANGSVVLPWINLNSILHTAIPALCALPSTARSRVSSGRTRVTRSPANPDESRAESNATTLPCRVGAGLGAQMSRSSIFWASMTASRSASSFLTESMA
jgi:hypothetical protein